MGSSQTKNYKISNKWTVFQLQRSSEQYFQLQRSSEQYFQLQRSKWAVFSTTKVKWAVFQLQRSREQHFNYASWTIFVSHWCKFKKFLLKLNVQMFCNFVQMTYMISDFLKNSKWFVTYYKWCLCNYEIPHILNQGFLLVKLKLTLRKFYGRHHDLVDRCGIYVSQMTTDMFHLSYTLLGPFLIHDFSLGL
jgi:hypothetical protein